MTEYLEAWQCIGCGKIDAPQTCIGVCQDRRVEFVYASDHKELLAQLRATQRHALAASAVLRRLASTKPHDHEWERSYRAIQEQARRVLTAIGSEEPQEWRELDCLETTA
jgi:HrpA-like RNA helicase